MIKSIKHQCASCSPVTSLKVEKMYHPVCQTLWPTHIQMAYVKFGWNFVKVHRALVLISRRPVRPVQQPSTTSESVANKRQFWWLLNVIPQLNDVRSIDWADLACHMSVAAGMLFACVWLRIVVSLNRRGYCWTRIWAFRVSVDSSSRPHNINLWITQIVHVVHYRYHVILLCFHVAMCM